MENTTCECGHGLGLHKSDLDGDEVCMHSDCGCQGYRERAYEPDLDEPPDEDNEPPEEFR